MKSKASKLKGSSKKTASKKTKSVEHKPQSKKSKTMKNEKEKTEKPKVATPNQNVENTTEPPPIDAPATPYPLPQVSADQQAERVKNIRNKYPVLTDSDMMIGTTPEEKAAFIAAKAHVPQEEILKALLGQ